MPGLLKSSRSTVSKDHKCTVQLLDDTQTMTIEFKKNDTGQVVLDYVCESLNVIEKDYFGLRYVDANRHRYWLDPTKPILRQMKSSSIVFAFRVKFYPIDPLVVKEELTRYLLALQLKRDLLHGRLYCPQNDAAVLGAYVVQSELGDYDPQEVKGNYVSQYKLFLNQTPKLEEKIAAEHQKLRGKGMTPANADVQFLKKACLLDTYGYYPYTIKDPKAGQVYLGATPHGVLVYQTHRKLHHLKWEDVREFDYVGKDFYIYPKPDYFDDNNIEEEDESELEHHGATPNGTPVSGNNGAVHSSLSSSHLSGSPANKVGSKKKPSLRFNCPSAAFCKHLWKYMLAQQVFFTKFKSNEIKTIAIRRGPLFRRSTFRYTGRVLQEIKEAPVPKRPEPSFERIHMQRQLPRDERSAPWANKFHTLPRATKPLPELNDTAHTTTCKEAPDQTLAKGDTSVSSSVLPSPVSQNGQRLENGPSVTFSDVSFDRTTMTVEGSPLGNDSSMANNRSYKSEVITVSLKHVSKTESMSADGTLTTTVVEEECNGQRPLCSSSAVSAGHDSKRNQIAANNVHDKHDVVDRTNSADRRTATNAGDSAGSSVLKTILTGLMFTVLLIGTVILVMEVQDPHFRRYLLRVPGFEAFRHQYYEPARLQAQMFYESLSRK